MSELSVESFEDTRLRSPWRKLSFVFLVVSILLFALVVAHQTAAPSEFPVGERILVPYGSTLDDIGIILEKEEVVRSPLLFKLIITSLKKETALRAGEYKFDEAYSVLEIARLFAEGEATIPPVRITFPEGSTLADFDAIVRMALPKFKEGDIIRAAEGKEGVLFPDTYLIPETDTAEDIVALLKDTFAERLEPFAAALSSSTLTQEDIIILASIIEREANDADSMDMVASILWKRLALNMPLQVDATFDYLLGKTSAELTPEDLEIDSPYNTYKYRGLPPTPIASPGLVAIEAVLSPAETEYLYYLTDADGVFHYARTFEDHKINKGKYLR